MLKTAAAQVNFALAPVPLSDAAFLFADIAGFTAFTELHGDARAAELAWRLRLGVEQQLGHDAHVIKTLGDAVMVRIADPAEAAAAGLRIVSRALPDAGDPAVRVGIHCGQAVEWGGDFFGAAVNLAARVAALAEPGTVLVSEQVAVAARCHGLQLGERSLRNIARPVALYAVRDGASESGDRLSTAAGCAVRRRRRGSARFIATGASARVQS